MNLLIAVLAVVLVAWFAAGTLWNVRLGNRTLRWLQEGLPLLGSRSTVRWLGSSVVELVINEGKAELARAAVVLFMEPRDLPWWPLSRMRGRRDTLIIRAFLRRPPAFECEVLDPASWSGRDALARIPLDWPLHSFEALQLRGDESRARAMLGRVAGFDVKRLSVRRSEPHVQLHIAFPGAEKPSRELFEAVHGLVELALK